MTFSYVSDGILYIGGKPYSGLTGIMQYSCYNNIYVLVDENCNVWGLRNNELTQITCDNNFVAANVFGRSDCLLLSKSGEVFFSPDLGPLEQITGLNSRAIKIGWSAILTDTGELYEIDIGKRSVTLYPCDFFVTDCMVGAIGYIIGYDSDGNKIYKPDNETTELSADTILGCCWYSCWTSIGEFYIFEEELPVIVGLQEPENIVYVDSFGDIMLVLYNDRTLLQYDASTGQPIGDPIYNVDLISDYIPRPRRNTKSSNM